MRTRYHSIAIWSLIALGALMMPAASGYSLQDSYVPPEIAHTEALRPRVTLPSKVNINTANLNQLSVLPGFDEELALKVIRHRPMAEIRDFYRIPGLEPKYLERLIQSFQPRIIFKYSAAVSGLFRRRRDAISI